MDIQVKAAYGFLGLIAASAVIAFLALIVVEPFVLFPIAICSLAFLTFGSIIVIDDHRDAKKRAERDAEIKAFKERYSFETDEEYHKRQAESVVRGDY